jgi:hypothetical protein
MKSLYYVCFLLLLAVHSKTQSKLKINKNIKLHSFIETEIKEDSDTIAKLNQCTYKNCKNGECISDTLCECKPEYSTIDDDKACTYMRKLQIVAFLLELLCPFGSSYMYLEIYKLAIIKFCFIVVYPIALLVIFCHCISNTHKQSSKNVQNILGYLVYGSYIVGFIAWYIYDLIRLVMNPIRDGNSISLIKW